MGRHRLHFSSLVGVLVALNFLSACTSFNRSVDTWVGAPIKDYLEVPGQLPPVDIRGPDEKGNRIYVVRIEKGADCVVFWNVDTHGIIRGWTHEGSSCKFYNY
jgi:hypothetical protein